MRDFERDLCRSLSFAKCKRKIAKRKKAAKPARVEKKKSGTPKPKAKPAQTVKKPEAKPENPFVKPDAPAVPVPPEKPIVAEPAKPAPPLPPEKPSLAKEPPPAEPALRQTAEPPAPAPAPPAPVDTAIGSVCRLRLDTLGVSYETVQENLASGACNVEHPVRLKAFKAEEASIEFPDGPVLKCEFAVKFIEWLRDTGAPIVRAQTNSQIARLWTGPGYQCRGRNGDASAKMSEHGFGNAVDITNLKLADGRIFEIRDALNPASPAYATLKGLRGSACGYFTTVLGPGSNEAHNEHFHFDLGKHGRSDNYKICE